MNDNQSHTTYPKHHRVIAIDPSYHLGWATLDNGVLTCGTAHFKRQTGRKTKEDEHEGIRFLNIGNWIDYELSVLRPDYLFYESPIGMNQAGAQAAQMAFGIKAILMAKCADHGIPMAGVAPVTLKKYATGSGRAQKNDMMHAAQQRFPSLTLVDDNAADAVHVLCYGMSTQFQLEAL